jgi:hypothetical protein
MKQEQTTKFVEFREIARLVWNLGFWGCEQRREIAPLLSYEEAMARLFEGMILRPLAETTTPGAHLWGTTLPLSGSAQFTGRFVGFFDWEQLALRDYRYVRLTIETMPDHPELVGREALIEFQFCRFWTE